MTGLDAVIEAARNAAARIARHGNKEADYAATSALETFAAELEDLMRAQQKLEDQS